MEFKDLLGFELLVYFYLDFVLFIPVHVDSESLRFLLFGPLLIPHPLRVLEMPLLPIAFKPLLLPLEVLLHPPFLLHLLPLLLILNVHLFLQLHELSLDLLLPVLADLFNGPQSLLRLLHLRLLLPLRESAHGVPVATRVSVSLGYRPGVEAVVGAARVSNPGPQHALCGAALGDRVLKLMGKQSVWIDVGVQFWVLVVQVVEVGVLALGQSACLGELVGAG